MQQAIERGAFTNGVAPAVESGRVLELEPPQATAERIVPFAVAQPRDEAVQPAEPRRRADGAGNWQSAYSAAVAGQVWYGLQWLANGLTTVAGVTILLATPALAGLDWLQLQVSPAVIYALAAVSGTALHLLLTSIEREVWAYHPKGNMLVRAWKRLVHLVWRPFTSLVSIVVVFALDIGSAYYGMYWVLAGRTLPIGTGWTLPTDTPLFMLGIAVLAVWVATTSEPGYTAANDRRKEIARHKERYFARLEALRSRGA